MQTISIANLLQYFSPLRLARPIFDKELRVASRRRRGYVLRCAYVLLLMVFIALVWLSAVQLRGGGAVSRAHMQAAARTITLGIVWFQFIGAQLAAVTMMSTAISEEVYGRTLCVLMTTPLSRRQVVMGKFSSRLFQILLLVATSLPLLAIVRVLGGIPWGYLVVSLCVTAATVIFVGAVSLLCSVLCRRAYVVVIVSILSVAFLFILAPLFAVILLQSRMSEQEALEMILYWNPLVLLYRYTDFATAPGTHALVSATQIITCCVLLLSATAGILACSVRLVTSVALRHAMGEPSLLDRLRRRQVEEDVADGSPRARRRGIRRVVGPPMIWKEMTCTISRRERFATAAVLGIEGLLIVVSYSFPAVMGVLGYGAAHIAYLWALLGLAVFFTVTASATGIARERETRAWPLLLMTPLSDTEIVVGKFLGVLRRCGLIWLSLLAYIAAFAAAQCLHPVAIVHMTLIILSALVFLSGTGFYFGSRCRRTADAVTANLVLAGTLWCILPILVETMAYGLGADGKAGTSLVCATVPFGQAVAMLLITLDGSDVSITWFGWSLDAWGAAEIMLISMAGYTLASLAFTWRAVRAFRRRIF